MKKQAYRVEYTDTDGQKKHTGPITKKAADLIRDNLRAAGCVAEVVAEEVEQ